ncbi:YdcF family protein [Amycolatopsis sp. 195334CR]|uniref:YdcF family protein n=1 Tax=Amycolatopsis sp. 195334CR TaxID=2814588 RepID=UPI001A905EE8|nr:YdcF family protein [Amycolatopsis sp. 195334CR]MBN6038322.1 YdcF family protein [Amycolatopsis sp. 195334CR]
MNPLLIPYLVAAGFFLLFLVSFLRDRRKLRNGFYLFFALVFLAVGVLFTVAAVSEDAAAILLFSVLALIPLTVLALGVFLICNGVTMLRREGRRPANLLSLAAGLGIIAFVPVNLIVEQIGWKPLEVFAMTVNALLFYVSFLFVCFLLYAIVYGRIRSRAGVDFVVVLGAGLLGGNRVPPLLAGRLDRGRLAFDAGRARGGDPVLVTSGGQGPDEDLPEAHAMADYLAGHGVPRDRILLEDRSRTTWENLVYSKEIMAEHRAGYRCVVVTNNYHVLRAALLARKAKVNGQVIGSRTAGYFWPSATIREFVAVLVEHRVFHLVVCGLIVLSTVLSQ